MPHEPGYGKSDILSIGTKMRLYAIALAILMCTPAQAWTPQTPDIVLIVMDDAGVWDIDAINPTSKVKTPAMDALVTGGTTFVKGRATSSVCSPTRYGILTGQYAWRTRLKSGVLMPYDPPLVDPATITLPEFLKTKGYKTTRFAKWHLGEQWVTTDGLAPKRDGSNVDHAAGFSGGPNDHGYDVYFGGTHASPPRGFVHNHHMTAQPTEQSTGWGWPGPQVPGWDYAEYQTGITDAAVVEIGLTATSTPLFVHYAPLAPHKPIVPVPPWKGHSQAGPYGDFIEQIDSDIGRIMTAVQQRGRPTVVFLVSDNGSGGYDGNGANFGNAGSSVTSYGYKPNGPLRGWKTEIYEGGVRVPFVVWWPGVVPAGQIRHDMVLTVDLYRTIARIVGYDVPPDQGTDSFDFWPQLAAGCDVVTPARTSGVVQDYAGKYAYYAGPWKLCGQCQSLYRLDSDGTEITNLWSTSTGVRDILLGQWTAIRDGTRTHP